MDPAHAGEVEQQALALLAPALAGAVPAWPGEAATELVDALVAVARSHGVIPLLHEALGTGTDWPHALRTRVRSLAREEAAAEAVHAAHVGRALGALEAASIRCIVFKGTALAYTLYARPSLRPRDDTDLLVAPDRAREALEVLQGLGYRAAPSLAGGRVLHQTLLVLVDARGLRVNLDLHWRVSNRPRYARAFDVSGLGRHAVPLLELAPNATAPGPVDAMLLACMHLHGHHLDAPRLIWLHDLRLLAEALDGGSRVAVARRAAELDLSEALGTSLALAHLLLGYTPPAPLDALAHTDLPARERHALQTMIEDLRATRGWGERAALLREHALPPAGYMLSRYGTRRLALLPALYLHRALRGAMRMLRRTR